MRSEVYSEKQMTDSFVLRRMKLHTTSLIPFLKFFFLFLQPDLRGAGG